MKILLIESEAENPLGMEGAVSDLFEDEVSLEQVEDLSSALERLSQGGVDLILLDLNLPDSQGLLTFERIYAFASDVPVVVLTELADEEVGLKTVRGGAQDYLIKGQVGPDLLRRSIRYAVERHRLNSALRSLSLIDDLTGLYNRRGFTDLGRQQLKLARRSGRSVLVVFLDVDRLKTINDTLGHQAGDQALMRLADVLRATFRKSDILARMGGDEFAIMAIEASEANETELLDRLRENLREVNHGADDTSSLSISAGTARYSGEEGTGLDDLLARADRMMYQEKKGKEEVREGRR